MPIVCISNNDVPKNAPYLPMRMPVSSAWPKWQLLPTVSHCETPCVPSPPLEHVRRHMTATVQTYTAIMRRDSPGWGPRVGSQRSIGSVVNVSLQKRLTPSMQCIASEGTNVLCRSSIHWLLPWLQLLPELQLLPQPQLISRPRRLRQKCRRSRRLPLGAAPPRAAPRAWPT